MQSFRRRNRWPRIVLWGFCGAAVAGGLKYLRRNDRRTHCRSCSRWFPLPVQSLQRQLDARKRIHGDPAIRGYIADLREGRTRRDLVTVQASAKVTEVIGLLKLHGVSQLPVVNNDKLIGIITEKQLLERALQGERSNTDVGGLAQTNYCTISDDTDIAVLTDLFRRSKVAIVLDDGQPVDIITRIDLIDYISKNSSARV